MNSIGRRAFHWVRLSTAFFLVNLVGLIVNVGIASAGSESVTVNLATTTGPAAGVGAGFLYGYSQDGTQPPDSLLAPLAPTSSRGGGGGIAGNGWFGDGYTAGTGFQARMSSVIAQAGRLSTSPYSGTYDILLSDIYGPGSNAPPNMVYPCTSGNCSNWLTFIDSVVGDIQNAGLGNGVRYDIWNEPDNSAFWPPGYGTTQYFQMWDTAYNEIRRLQPNAVIVGPSVSNFNTNYLATFFNHVKSAGTVPNFVNWHFSGSPIADAQTVNNMLQTDGITGVKLAMNEYLAPGQQNAGQEAWYLAQVAKSALSEASHAIWSNCCAVGTLDSTLVTDSSGDLRPTGQWWAYRAYAEVTGQLASESNNGGTTDAVAAEDSTRQLATVLLGDSAGNTGTVTLTINGLSSTPWLFGTSGAQVDVQRIPDQGPLAQPLLLMSEALPSGTSSVQIPINWAAANDAYFVTLSPAYTGTTIIDGAVTAKGPNYFQYGRNWGQTNGVTDMYDETANWSYTPGSTAIFHFVGSQVLLHAVRDVDQGEMSLSVDGSLPVTVDDYASTRNASGVVWTSPVLNPGPHVLTVTVLSTKNPASSGYNIAIDRADIVSYAVADTPFGGTAVAVPGTVEAANYDTGGQGVAYNVSSVNGTANGYRSDGVDLEVTGDNEGTSGTGAGYDLGWTSGGQWFNYTVNVASAGTYAVSLRLASPGGVTDAFHIANSAGQNLSGPVNAPQTGGWQTWTTATANVTLPAGQQVLTVYQDNGGWNIHFMSFAGVDAPFGGTAAAVPGLLQAANYDTGGQGVAYNVGSVNGTANGYRSDGVDLEVTSDTQDTSGTGAGYDLGWTSAGQWFNYSVNVASAGTYTISFRLAAPGAVSDAFHVANSAGQNLSGPVNAPATGGYQDWATATANVTLPAGLQVLTVHQDNGAWNIHFMSFAAG